MLVSSKSKTITDLRGTVRSLAQTMLLPGKRPESGWQSSITFNGSKVVLTGATPQDVVHSLRVLLTHNKVEFSETDLWMTLNVGWLASSAEADRCVSLVEFLSLCVIREGDGSFAGRIPTSVWMPPMLDAMGYFLASDAERFTHDNFVSMAKVMRLMADPSFSYRTGDYRSLTAFLARYDNLRYKPCYLIEEAREWLLQTYNSMADIANLETITRSIANIKYNW